MVKWIFGVKDSGEWKDPLPVESPKPKRVLTETVLDVLASRVGQGQEPYPATLRTAPQPGGPYALETMALHAEFVAERCPVIDCG